MSYPSRLLPYLAALAALLFGLVAETASAQDGTSIGSYASGAWTVQEYLLCDGTHTSTDCAEFDLHTSAGGLPDHLVVSLRRDNCQTTANRMQIQLASLPGLNGPAASTPGLHALGTLAWDGGGGGVSSLTLSPLTHRYIRGESLAAGTGVCTDFEVVLRLMYRRYVP